MTTTRVLVVDDSAFARKVVRESLQTSPQIEVVGTARDGIDALEKITALQPDVITLDLEMPKLDGLGVLAALTPAQRARVIVVSMADGESDIGISALSFGVFDLVHKPTALAVASLHDIAEELVTKVLLASAQAPGRAQEFETIAEPPLAPGAISDRVVLIGTSTGGPQALTRLLKAFPANFPAPIAIVLHIPAGYTGPLAERLNAECALEVLEAQPGLELRPGRAVLAQAGVHMRLVASGDVVTVRLDPEPSSSVHRPSVNVLFESARRPASAGASSPSCSRAWGTTASPVRAPLPKQADKVLTEAEASCVVYGMPLE